MSETVTIDAQRGSPMKLRSRQHVFGRLLAIICGLVVLGLLFAYGAGTGVDQFGR